jgi:hypothetical protein
MVICATKNGCCTDGGCRWVGLGKVDSIDIDLFCQVMTPGGRSLYTRHFDHRTGLELYSSPVVEDHLKLHSSGTVTLSMGFCRSGIAP